MQFQQVLLLVACQLTQLTFCVSELYIFLALYCFFLIIILLGVLEVVSELSQPIGLCTEPEIVSSTLSRLLYSSWGKWTNKRRRKKNEILDYFDGLVLDYITKLSGVQSVIAECSLYICVHSILQEKKAVE